MRSVYYMIGCTNIVFNHKLILDNNWQFYMNVYYLSPL